MGKRVEVRTEFKYANYSKRQETTIVSYGSRSASVSGEDAVPALVALAAALHPSPPEELAAVATLLTATGEVVVS